MNKETTFDDFKKKLFTMTNVQLAEFLTFYAETINEQFELLPIYFTKVNDGKEFLEWVGRYAENYGEPNDNVCKYIITQILKNAYNKEFVLVGKTNYKKETVDLTFFNKQELKKSLLDNPIITKLFADKNVWNNPLYSNGSTNDVYVLFNKYVK